MPCIITSERASQFWSSALPIVASYLTTSSELYLKNKLGEQLSEEEEALLWDEEHKKGAVQLKDTVNSLKGFYVKTAQIIASRQDLFPPQYTEALSDFTDNVDPMPASLSRLVIERELLNRNETFEDIFSEFEEEPLGSASIAQVHKAVLTEKYGGPREVGSNDTFSIFFTYSNK